MFFQGVFKQKGKSVIGLGILFCALLWALTVADQPMPWEERERKREAAKQEIREAEQMLVITTDSARADQLRFRIAELSLSVGKGPVESLRHLKAVNDTTTDTQRLCLLLWQAARRLQLPGRRTLNWQGADWDRIKPAYERILRFIPESDLARRALYQLGRYYLARKDFCGWRTNREEFIRRFGERAPFYALVAAKEIGDSFLFEGDPEQAQKQYEQLLGKISEGREKSFCAKVYLRLLQTSWFKPTPPAKVHIWKQGLATSLGLRELKEYDVSGWLDQLLKENRDKARIVSLKEWSECEELWPYDFVQRFNEGLYDHALLKERYGLFKRFSKKARTRKKVARVKADLRTIATALESYMVDMCKGYPPVKGGGLRLLAGVPAITTSKGQTSRESPPYLERTPRTIKYLRLIPLDPFAQKPHTLYHYYTVPHPGGYIVISRGPDGSLEIDPPNDYDVRIPHPAPKLLIKTYDPTNGTFSAGDIFRVPQ